MTVICPTITAANAHQYRSQIERVTPFAKRIHIDFMDGVFAPTKSPPVEEAWWPDDIAADLHVMYEKPTEHMPAILKLKPNLVVLHAEADGDFESFSNQLRAEGIKAGVALLEDTPVSLIAPYLVQIDHVLIFGGHLGYHGGQANLSLLGKVSELKHLKPELEISWDGGINEHNARTIVKSGVDVLNVGGYIQKSSEPYHAYDRLIEIVSEK